MKFNIELKDSFDAGDYYMYWTVETQLDNQSVVEVGSGADATEAEAMFNAIQVAEAYTALTNSLKGEYISD